MLQKIISVLHILSLDVGNGPEMCRQRAHVVTDAWMLQKIISNVADIVSPCCDMIGDVASTADSGYVAATSTYVAAGRELLSGWFWRMIFDVANTTFQCCER